jgi:ornithine carbamoyltransferase
MQAGDTRHFLRLSALTKDELEAILAMAHEIKRGQYDNTVLSGLHIALIFSKPSTRTRVSFEVGISRLGGTTLVLNDQEIQIGVREPIADIARVLSRYVDGIVVRLSSEADLYQLAKYSSVPVINGLSDFAHPCQALADVMTMQELLGNLRHHRICYIGDGNNVANSLIAAANILGFQLIVITPPGYEPQGELGTGLEDNGSVVITNDLTLARDCSIIYTDVWASMGKEHEKQQRYAIFQNYQVNNEIMRRNPKAYFMHCLPAHRGEEVSNEVIDGDRSVVFDQAENRLHAQMALLTFLYRR